MGWHGGRGVVMEWYGGRGVVWGVVWGGMGFRGVVRGWHGWWGEVGVGSGGGWWRGDRGGVIEMSPRETALRNP